MYARAVELRVAVAARLASRRRRGRAPHAASIWPSKRASAGEPVSSEPSRARVRQRSRNSAVAARRAATHSAKRDSDQATTPSAACGREAERCGWDPAPRDLFARVARAAAARPRRPVLERRRMASIASERARRGGLSRLERVRPGARGSRRCARNRRPPAPFRGASSVDAPQLGLGDGLRARSANASPGHLEMRPPPQTRSARGRACAAWPCPFLEHGPNGLAPRRAPARSTVRRLPPQLQRLPPAAGLGAPPRAR